MGSSNSNKKSKKSKQQNNVVEASIQQDYDSNFDPNFNEVNSFYYNDPYKEYNANNNCENFDERMNKRIVLNRISENTNNFIESQKYPFDDRRIKFSKEQNYAISPNLDNHYSQFPNHYQQYPMDGSFEHTFDQNQYEMSRQGRPLTRESEFRRIQFYPPYNPNTNCSQEIDKMIYNENQPNQYKQPFSKKASCGRWMNDERRQTNIQNIPQRVPIQFREANNENHKYKRNQSQEIKLVEMRNQHRNPDFEEHYYLPKKQCNNEIQKYIQENSEPFLRTHDDLNKNALVSNYRSNPPYLEENQYSQSQFVELENRSNKKGYFKKELKKQHTISDLESENHFLKLNQVHEEKRIPLSKYY